MNDAPAALPWNDLFDALVRIAGLDSEGAVRDVPTWGQMLTRLGSWLRVGVAAGESGDLNVEVVREDYSGESWPPVPDPQGRLRPGTYFGVYVFRDRPGDGEIGLQAWFESDSAWEAIEQSDSWDRDHPIGYSWFVHDRGADSRERFVEAVSNDPVAAPALERVPLIYSVGRTGGDDVQLWRS